MNMDLYDETKYNIKEVQEGLECHNQLHVVFTIVKSEDFDEYNEKFRSSEELNLLYNGEIYKGSIVSMTTNYDGRLGELTREFVGIFYKPIKKIES